MGIAPNAALQPAHLFQSIFGAVVLRIVQRLLGAPNSHRRFAGNLFGGLHSRRQSTVSIRQHLVDQTVVQSFVCVQAASGVSQFFHHRHGHEFG